MRQRARPDLWEPGEGNLPRPPGLAKIGQSEQSLCILHPVHFYFFVVEPSGSIRSECR